MKISGKGNGPNSASIANSGKAAGIEGMLDTKSTDKAGKTAASSSGSSSTEISARGQDMLRAKELATPNNDVDDAKVARLQKMIDEGSYKMDAGAIADRLLDEQSKMG